LPSAPFGAFLLIPETTSKGLRSEYVSDLSLKWRLKVPILAIRVAAPVSNYYFTFMVTTNIRITIRRTKIKDIKRKTSGGDSQLTSYRSW